MDITIRPEAPREHRTVEELIRDAFWNLYVPGCDEHYLAHIMRSHPDFCHDLNFVAEVNGTIAGSIMYTRSYLLGPGQERLDTVTFGPVSVAPAFQRQGIGSALIRHTTALVRSRGIPAIIIYGNPSNYVSLGFVGSRNFSISTADGTYPSSMLVLPLRSEVLISKEWRFHDSTVFQYDKQEAEKFDAEFPPLQKEYRYTQELFSILSRSVIV